MTTARWETANILQVFDKLDGFSIFERTPRAVHTIYVFAHNALCISRFSGQDMDFMYTIFLYNKP